jgi:phosphatidylinositol alpha-1,6-mannosyltransferase
MSNYMPKRPYIITLEYPPERGGVGRYLHSLAQASEGELHVVVPMGRNMATVDETVNTVQMFRDAWPRWWPIVSLCRKLKDQASCLLVSHVLPVGTASMISKWFGGPPYVLLFHGLDARLIRTSFWKTFLTRLIIRNALAIFANSHSTVREMGSLAGAKRVTVVTPGVSPLPSISRSDARSRLGIGEKESVILAVGRLIDRKGFDVLIRSASHLPTSDRIRIVIIGNGPEEDELRKLASASPHPVSFILQASDEHLGEWYSASDVFCLPVKEDPIDFEGFGIVFIEASSAGLPIVSGRAGGVEEAVLDRETGILVNGSDSKEVARALIMLLGDPELRLRLGTAGRKRALKDFRWEDRWKVFKEYFDSVV